MNTSDHCPICERAANLHTSAEADHCWSVKMQRDSREQIIRHLVERQAIQQGMERVTFSSSAPGVEARQPDTWTAAREFVDSGNLSCFMHGPAGTGKTFAALSMLNQSIDKCAASTWAMPAAAFVVATKFVRQMRLFDPGSILELWENCQLLVLDDLDKPHWDRRDVAALWEILDHRQRSGLKTVITTNVKPDELRSIFPVNGNASMFDSIRQRMTPRLVLEFKGASLRTPSVTQHNAAGAV